MTGRVLVRGANVVTIDDRPLRLSMVPFLRFVRLVVATVTTPSGWVPQEELLGGVAGELTNGIDQMLLRLRQPFTNVLNEVQPTQFIEKSHNQVRLSTHRRYVNYDREVLLGHPLEAVRAMAALLPLPQLPLGID